MTPNEAFVLNIAMTVGQITSWRLGFFVAQTALLLIQVGVIK